MLKYLKTLYFSHKRTIHSFFWRSLQIFAKQGIVFFIFLICTQFLSREDFGVYNYLVAAVFLLIMLGDFGISTATSKYVAEHDVHEKHKVPLVLLNAGLIIVAAACLLIIVGGIVAHFILKDLFGPFLYVLPLVLLVPLTSLQDGIYRGLRKFKQLSIISLIVGGVSLITSYCLVRTFGLTGALLSQVILYALTLVGLFLGHRDHVYKIDFSISKEIGSYSVVYGLAVIGYYLFAKIDVLILGQAGFLKEVATYELLNKIFWVLLFPFAIVGQVIAPEFARWNVEGSFKKIYEKLIKHSIFFIVCGVTLSVISYFIIPFGLKQLFPVYVDRIFFTMFPVSLGIFFINVLASSIDSGIVVPTGHASIMTRAYLLLGVSNILLAYALLHLFGYIGVVWATLISSALMIIYVRFNFMRAIKRKAALVLT